MGKINVVLATLYSLFCMPLCIGIPPVPVHNTSKARDSQGESHYPCASNWFVCVSVSVSVTVTQTILGVVFALRIMPYELNYRFLVQKKARHKAFYFLLLITFPLKIYYNNSAMQGYRVQLPAIAETAPLHSLPTCRINQKYPTTHRQQTTERFAEILLLSMFPPCTKAVNHGDCCPASTNPLVIFHS